MPRTTILHSNFSSGELSPIMRGRMDLPRYLHGARTLLNFEVLLQGGLRKRSGTRYVATAFAPGAFVRLVPFIFRSVDALILEVGHQYMRFYKNGARVEVSPGTPVHLVTPYLSTDVFRLRFAQKNDIVYITHPSYQPYKLLRVSDQSWSLQAVVPYPPPTVEKGLVGGGILTLSVLVGTGTATVTGGSFFMLSDVDREIQAGQGRAVITAVTSSTFANVTVVQPFIQNTWLGGTWRLAGSPAADIVPSKTGPPGALVDLVLQPPRANNLVSNGTFTNATGWADLDVGDADSQIRGGQLRLAGGTITAANIARREATLTGLTTGIAYTIEADVTGQNAGVFVATTSGGADLLGAYLSVGQGQTVEFIPTATTVYLSFYSDIGLTSIVDNVSVKPTRIAGWRVADQQKYVYLHDGVAYINAVSADGTLVIAQIINELSTLDPAPAGQWSLEENQWNQTDGYPSVSTFHEQRWMPGSSPGYPQTVWGSVSGDFENFARGSKADDAFAFTLADAQGFLNWMVAADQLVLGAENGPYRMAGDAEGALVASAPPLVRPVGETGAGPRVPLRIGGAILYAERQGSTLTELLIGQQGALSTSENELSELSQHLFATSGISEMAYVPRPLPVVRVVRADGLVCGLTYRRSQTVAAWHRHQLGGNIPGIVESVAVIPHPTVSTYQTWLLVVRTIGGSGTRYIEVMDDTCVGVDAAQVYAGGAVSGLSGLAHLNGQTVRAAGIPVGGSTWVAFPAAVVSGGNYSFPVQCTQAYAGVPYTATVETLPAEAPGAPQAGPSIQVQKKRWDRLTASFDTTGGAVTINGHAHSFIPAGTGINVGSAFFTGDVSFPLLGWDQLGRLLLTHSEPLPCTVLTLGGALTWGDQ